jgi:pullulanase
MTKDVNGTWIATLDGDKNGTYYTYEVVFDTEIVEACDPYARTTGVNGDRAMILDMASTNPTDWDKDVNPFKGNITDAFIYELHVRDISSDPSSGHSAANVGKYLGVIERGTKTPGGKPTGLDHIVNLGVTHVHLLPVYDFGSVDESKVNDPNAYNFNWGYDPQNYNVPEGSYSTDPFRGEVRVKEFKQMVKGMHDAGLAVVMDVVYNHVYNSTGFCFNKIVPGYFSRPGSNGSGCGNDTASERAMVSKYIVDSVNYWADEYHIDGFRFDLVGLIDVDTINTLVTTVKEKHPETIFYGEGWSMSTVTTKNVQMATQTNAKLTPNFAYFSDNIRNLVKGNTFGGVSAGFISGGAASTVDLNACFRGMPSWCPSPSQSINYISCHDNNTLFDHIMMVAKNNTTAEHISMNKLGVAFYMTAQGVPFFQAGEEILRSKPNGDGTFNENSYNAPDAINSIKWGDLDKAEYQDVYEYYQGLIAFRKAHPALRLTAANDVDATVTNLSGLPEKVVGYSVAGGINGETAEGILCYFNPNAAAATITLPEGEWNICVNGEDASAYSLGKVSGTAEISGLSALILVKGDIPEKPAEDVEPDVENPTTAPSEQGGEKDEKGEKNNNRLGLWIALGAVAVVAIAVVVVLIISKKK